MKTDIQLLGEMLEAQDGKMTPENAILYMLQLQFEVLLDIRGLLNKQQEKRTSVSDGGKDD